MPGCFKRWATFERQDDSMSKVTAAVCSLALAATGFISTANAQGNGKMDERLDKAATVIDEVMAAPDHAIPDSILSRAKCVLVIPSEKKAAFLVGGTYGQGVATCRTDHGWSAPVFVKLGGASFGFQLGGQETDLVLLGMNDKSVQDMLHSKVKLGADASAAAGPVGRDAQASTGILLNAEFLTYSRSKGLFGGLDLTGDILEANKDDMKAEYGPDVHDGAVLHGAVPTPPNAEHFVHTVAQHFVAARNQ
jgi:lipid-binding SYLF domain-containing protein